MKIAQRNVVPVRILGPNLWCLVANLKQAHRETSEIPSSQPTPTDPEREPASLRSDDPTVRLVSAQIRDHLYVSVRRHRIPAVIAATTLALGVAACGTESKSSSR